MEKITHSQILKIINEELDRVKNKPKLKALSEDVDHTNIVVVTKNAGDLLKALLKFDEKATESMKEALVTLLPNLKQILEQMLQTPSAYVPAAARKVVRLRPEKTKD